MSILQKYFKKYMNIRIKTYLLYLWATIILVLISWPTAECIRCTVFTWYDKIAHVFLFGIFSYLLALVLKSKTDIKLFYILIISLILSAFYSALCEFIQIFVPGRTVSEYDFFAGVIGIIIFLSIFYEYFKNKKT